VTVKLTRPVRLAGASRLALAEVCKKPMKGMWISLPYGPLIFGL
jgi:hypothetical protein